MALPNGKYVFIEHTTVPEARLYEKLKGDLGKCLNSSKTGVPTEKIEQVVFCYTSYLSAEQENALAEDCQEKGIKLSIFGIGPLSFDLLYKYPILARHHLGVEVDTGQVITPAEFIDSYNKNKLATRLDTEFHFREEEVEQVALGLEENDLVIVSGRHGVGKSRVALESCERCNEAHRDYKVCCTFNRGVNLFEDILVHFAEPGAYKIFEGDADRISKFEYVVQ